MINIRNPILSGFHPDPSIVRVGSDYYLATSTFEWFPGVQLYHSNDLENWDLLGHALDRTNQLDMSGTPDSCGVWAPCLSYDQGTFYLVYSNVQGFDPLWNKTPNYLVTSKNLTAGWSDPIFLSTAGFDGSLFHDDDGRKWYLSLYLDEARQNLFGGILLQEYSPQEKKLIGAPKIIFTGTALGKTEGPHLYKIDGYYYLITAEGGTEYDHAVTVARSKLIAGTYESSPYGSIVSTRNHPTWPLQKTGHGDLFEDGKGNWFIVFLTSRPLETRGRCTLGRETAIEEIVWKDGWPVLKVASDKPRIEIGRPTPAKTTKTFYNFLEGRLAKDWQSLRQPVTEDWLTFGPEGLSLLGRQSLTSWSTQSLIARRICHFHVEVETHLTINCHSPEEAAGLVFYYNSAHYHYLQVTYDESPMLKVVSCDQGKATVLSKQRISDGPIQLKGRFIGSEIQFYWKQQDVMWCEIGEALDGSILSDDYVQHASGTYKAAFTGAFVGLCCQGPASGETIATFRYFSYKSEKIINH